MLRNVHVHDTANTTGDWTTDHVTAITAAITSAPTNAISPYDPKRLLQHLADATRTTATIWTKAQRNMIRWLVRYPEASAEQLADFVTGMRSRAEDRAKSGLSATHKQLYKANRAFGSLNPDAPLRFHHGAKDAAQRERITRAFQDGAIGGFTDHALVSTSRSLQKAVKKSATDSSDNSAAIGAAVASLVLLHILVHDHMHCVQ